MSCAHALFAVLLSLGRMAAVLCTWLQKVATWMWYSSCLQGLGRRSMTELMTDIPCCTGQPKRATVRQHATSCKNSKWTRRTETRCVGCQRKMCSTVLGLHAWYMCVYVLLCAVNRETRRCHLGMFTYSNVHGNNKDSCGTPSGTYLLLLTGSCLVVDHQFQYWQA